jgi:hypothetical protein
MMNAALGHFCRICSEKPIIVKTTPHSPQAMQKQNAKEEHVEMLEDFNVAASNLDDVVDVAPQAIDLEQQCVDTVSKRKRKPRRSQFTKRKKGTGRRGETRRMTPIGPGYHCSINRLVEPLVSDGIDEATLVAGEPPAN